MRAELLEISCPLTVGDSLVVTGDIVTSDNVRESQGKKDGMSKT